MVSVARSTRGVRGPTGPAHRSDRPDFAWLRPSPSGGLALLEDPDRVAERIANAHVRAVEVVGGLLREIGHTAPLERLVQLAGIVGDEHEAAQRALGDELPDLRRGRLVVQRRAWLLQ